ncbi:MAG: hypothetical protein ABRQ37_05470 [Candidatus Eremiobacterota bacterium]
MRKFIGVVSLLVVVFLVAMTLQFVFAQEGGKPPSKEIEIKPGEATPAPKPTQAGEYQPNVDSGQPQPFNNLLESGGAPPTNMQQPTAPPTLPPKSSGTSDSGKTGQATPPPPVATATPATTEGVPKSVPQKPAKIDNSVIQGLFKYTGWLWNGSEYVGIVTSSKKGYTVKAGMELEDGYRVLQVNEKEVVLVKEGQKGTLPFQQEVQK